MKDDEENFVSRIISRQKNPPSIIVEEYACNIFSRERTPPKVEDEFFEKYGLENFVRLHIYIWKLGRVLDETRIDPYIHRDIKSCRSFPGQT